MLGLSVGLVCLASCGAVLVPWLVAQQRSVAGTARLLAQVLAGRLAGYLLFACLAWAAGAALVPGDLRARALVFGLAHVALAGTLLWYVLAPPHRPGALRAGRSKLRPYGDSDHGNRSMLWRRVARLGPPALGFLTGINLCPPFVVATVRAAQAGSLPASLAFFAVFFVGTSVWFVPFLAAGGARRHAEARLVARVAMAVVAVYYAYLGTIALGWRLLHG